MNKEETLIVLEAILALRGRNEILDMCLWVTQDADGEWWGYREKPIFEGGSGCRLGTWNIEGTDVYRLGTTSPPADASKMVFRL